MTHLPPRGHPPTIPFASTSCSRHSLATYSLLLTEHNPRVEPNIPRESKFCYTSYVRSLRAAYSQCRELVGCCQWAYSPSSLSICMWRCTEVNEFATHIPLDATAGVPTPGNTESPQHHTFSSGCTAFGRAPVRLSRLEGPYVPFLRRKKRACDSGVPMHVTLILESISGMICT